MLTLRRFVPALLLLLVPACDDHQLLAPNAAVVGGVKAPSGTSALPLSGSTVLVTWTDNAVNEDGFRVERSATPAGPWVLAGNTGAGGTSFSDGQRASEQQVCYRVVAVRRNNESVASNSDCTAPPAAPTGLTATRVDQQTVQLAWTDRSSVEDGYVVERANAEGGPYSGVADLDANAVGYRDGGLSVAAYWYRVRAKKDGGFGDYSNVAFVSNPGAPLAPSGLSAVPGNSNWITITWIDNATNETGVRLQRSLNAGATWATVLTMYGSNMTSASDYSPTSEREACYRVIAFNDLGDSPPSNPDCTTPPAAPSALTAKALDYQTVDLAWADNSASEDGYEVERVRQNESWAKVADLPPNSKTYRDVATSDATYWYRVRAKKDGGFSNFSNSAQVTLASVPPAAPSGLNAKPASSTIAVMTWSDNSSNEEGFRIERGPTATGPWEVAGTTGVSIKWFYDAGRTSEREVCYRVVAFNAAGESPSNTDCTTPPAAPTNLTATRVEGAVDLRWDDNSAVEDGYQVWRSYWYCDPDPYYGGGCYEVQEPIVTLGPNMTSYSDTIYWSDSSAYFVVALKDDGSSNESNWASPTP